MKDATGRDIAVGDRVAVCNRHGSSVWLDVREVVALDDKGWPTLKSTRATRKYGGTSIQLVKLCETK